jgi:hypothetical protein
VDRDRVAEGGSVTFPTIYYRPPATLARFMDSPERVRCAVGPIGSGKSTACIMELLRRAAEQKRGRDGRRRTRFAVVRNSYRQLKDTTRKTFSEWVHPTLGDWSEQDFTFRARWADVESEIMFRSLDRPEDVKKLLSLELTGAYVNEARELSKPVFDALTGRIGRFPSRVQGGPTWRGIFMDSNPWHAGHWAAKLFKAEPGFKLFRQPGGLSPDAENLENLEPTYYQDLLAGKDQQWIDAYVHGQDSAGDIGSIYGDLIDQLERRGGLAPFTHEAGGTYCAWDLGVADAEAIFWYQINAKGAVDVIDHFESSGKPHSFYWEEVDARPWKVVRHWLPHDARQRSAQTGLSTVQQFATRWPGKIGIVPSLSIADGITAARWLLEQPTRFHPRCAQGVELLRQYRYEFDEATRTFSKKPVHDHASNTSDAWRYLALAFANTSNSEKARAASLAPKAEPDIPPLSRAITLDKFWEHQDSLRGTLARRRRI